MAQKLGDPPYTTTDPTPELIRRVADVLDEVCSGAPDAIATHFPALATLSSEDGFAIAIAPYLESEDDYKRLYAATILLSLSALGQHNIGGETVKKCEAVLILSLQHASSLVRFVGTALLTQNDLPTEAVGPLRRQLRGHDAKLTKMAAIALSRSHTAELEAFRILETCLNSQESEGDNINELAAAALLQMGIQQRPALDAIRRRFNEFPPLVLRHFLVAAYKIGPGASGLFDLMATTLTDNSQEAQIRQWCASALGSVTRGSNRATPLLLTALRSPDPLVLHGASLGLAASGDVPSAVCDILSNRLATSDVDLRRAAAEAVDTLYQVCVPMIPLLISRLAEETDHPALARVARALAAIGKPAIRSLIDTFDHANMQVEEYASIALASIGPDAAEAIGDLIPIPDNLRKFKILLNILENMGSNAAPAIPTLTIIFEVAVHEHLLLQVIRILFFCGPAAAPAIPVLVKHVAQRLSAQNDVDFWVKQTLLCHPTKAVRELREALHNATGAARTRLKVMLAEFDSGSINPPSRLVGFPRIWQIRQFVALGDALNAHGPCSMRKVGDLLKEQPPSKDGKHRGFSTTTLNRAMRALRAWVKMKEPLITASGKSTWRLTVEGHALLQDCKDFLQSIDHPSNA